LTAAKFKPFVFSVPGFALTNIANICIFMILNDITFIYTRQVTALLPPPPGEGA
jgi:hypothetical protein